MGSLTGMGVIKGALINKNTFEGGGALIRAGAKSNHYGTTIIDFFYC